MTHIIYWQTKYKKMCIDGMLRKSKVSEDSYHSPAKEENQF